MPHRPERTPEVAHVLFMDVVGYSVLPMDRQRSLLEELQDHVRLIPQFVDAHAKGELISLPTGDGMALVFFVDPRAPFQCALSLAEALKASPQFSVRMGIHTGPVYRIDDINANRNIAGGGINYAQRVMDCGDGGHILLSSSFADILLQLGEFKDVIHYLGEAQLKHGVRLRIYNAFTANVGNPSSPSKLSSSLSGAPSTSESTAMRPMSPSIGQNPFDPWTPATPPAFVGRTGLLARLQGALDEGRSVSIVGDWRIGKSSLLKTYMGRLEKSGRPVRLLSGEGREGTSPAVFVECATGVKPDNGSDGAADVLSNWARQVHKPGITPALLVDEFDTLVLRFDHRFFERLRGMLDSLCMVVSSRRELDRVYRDLGRTSPFHNRLELFWLGLLESEAADALRSRSEHLLPSSAHRMVTEWAGRHPFFIQLFCRKLVDSYRYGENVEDAEEQFLIEGGTRIRELWTTLSDHDRNTLMAATATPQPQARSLRRRGLLTEDGHPFGRLLVDWLRDESERQTRP